MGIWGENRELMDQFRKKMAANPDGIMAMIDDMDLPKRNLAIGGSVFRRIEVPVQIPARLERWYRAKDMYVGKVMPEYRWAFSEKLCREMEKDFLSLAPLYQTLRGILDE